MMVIQRKPFPRRYSSAPTGAKGIADAGHNRWQGEAEANLPPSLRILLAEPRTVAVCPSVGKGNLPGMGPIIGGGASAPVNERRGGRRLPRGVDGVDGVDVDHVQLPSDEILDRPELSGL